MSEPLPLVLVGAGGRMGRLIAQRALADPRFRLHGLVDRRDSEALGTQPWGDGTPRIVDDVARACDGADAVIIEFALASATADTLRAACAARRPLVLGTTGHDAATRDAIADAARDIPLLHAANMSRGVTALLAHLGALSHALAGFDARIVEVHHTAKKDAPSGTALALGAALHREGVEYASLRAGSVPGIHTVFFGGTGEHIEITHRAESRDCFAAGALDAAAWLAGRPAGLYGMHDVIDGSGA